jgi:hypothetical protein
MKLLSPVEIALVIAGLVSTVGFAIALLRNRSVFAGYREVAADAKHLRAALNGMVFRDGSDLVVTGSFQKWPVVVRFSNSDNTPGLSLRMLVPANFSLSLASAGMQVINGGRHVVPTGDHLFDARFTARTNHPAQARLFLTRATATLLQKLCCSSKTLLSVSQGALEVSELITPLDVAKHALAHLEVMARLAEELRNMPGADKVKVAPFRRERHLLGRVAIVAGAVFTLASVLAATRASVRSVAAQGKPQPQLPSGMVPLDAQIIPAVSGWRLAVADDFDPAGAYWMRTRGVEPSGHIELDFSGSGNPRDTVYVLASASGERRVVLLSGHRNLFDSRFPALAAVARVPAGIVNSIAWSGGNGPQAGLGDGLLVVTGAGENTSAVVLFVHDSRLFSFVPQDYQQIHLQ